MRTEEISYIIIQVAIIIIICILFILTFDFLLDFSIFLLVVSLVILGFLVNDILHKRSLNKTFSKYKKFAEFISEIFLLVIIMGIVQSMIYFYFNFDGGYFYSILFFFGIIAVLVTISNNQILQEPKKVYLYLFNGLLIFYLSIYEYATIFDFTIIEINSLNPLSFISGLLFTIPYNFFLSTFLLFKTNVIIETLLIHIGLLLLLGLANVFVVIKSNILLFQKNFPSYFLVRKPNSISKTPLILFIIYLAFLQVGNGLSEFLDISMWLLACMFVFYSVVQIQNNHMHDILHLKLIIILLMLLMCFVKYIYPLLINITLIDSLLVINGTNELFLQIIMFFVLNLLFFIMIHYVLNSLYYTKQIEISTYCYFLLLAFLIFNLPFILLKILAVSFLVFFFNLNENSINLKEKNNSKIITTKRLYFYNFLQKLTQLSVFYVAFLLM